MNVLSPVPGTSKKPTSVPLRGEGREELPAERVPGDVGEWPLTQPQVDMGELPLERIPLDRGDSSLRRSRSRQTAASRPRAKRLLRWGQWIFLLAGLVAAGYCGWFYAKAEIFQTYQSWRFDQIMSHQAASVKDLLASYLPKALIALTNRAAPSRVNMPLESPSPHPSPPPLSEEALIGRIKVPRLGLSTIVLEGDSDRVLSEAVGHVPGTALPGESGNVGLAGHRDTFFRALKNIRKDDSISLETTTGTYQYRVDSVRIVGPDDAEVLRPTDRANLTLVTCYPFYFVGSAPKRYVVQAQQIASSGVGQGQRQKPDTPAGHRGGETIGDMAG
jgi:sortase A